MMVLRHVGPPSATVVSHNEETTTTQGEDRPAIPIDLSNKQVRCAAVTNASTLETTKSPALHHSNKSLATRNHHASLVTTISGPRVSDEEQGGKLCRGSSGHEIRWRELNIIQGGNDEDNSYSSPDSGLHRDSPGDDHDDEDVSSSKPISPPLSLSARNKQKQTLIPLSLIRARYNHNVRTEDIETPGGGDEDSRVSTKSGSGAPDQVLTKRARLEEMVTHIKSSKDRSRRHSGDDDTSSGGHVTSSDEITEDGPRDLSSLAFGKDSSGIGAKMAVNLNLPRDGFGIHDDEDMEEEPCNLVCPKSRSVSLSDSQNFGAWKNKAPPKNMQPLSPSDAAKMYGVDPDTYQQQVMQLQLTSAAMLGDPGGLLKAMGSYPPWVYLGYYSQLLHSFQAQEILRQYAMQSQNITPTISQGEKSPSVPRTLGSSGYNCRSPLSPASLSEGPTGIDSDSSMVGQTTPGSANGKRAPRAMTGRHVRTGTGASPATLQTLRQKIEERQRIKAQQVRHDVVMQSHSKGKNSKYLKKSKK